MIGFIASMTAVGAMPADNPVADPSAVVTKGNARFTVLTPGIVRMEYAPGGTFEDRPSQVIVNRSVLVSKFEVGEDDFVRKHKAALGLVIKPADDMLYLHTDRMLVAYKDDRRPFDADNLAVLCRGIDGKWDDATLCQPPFKPKSNLGGTTRTLDSISGRCPIDDGILSRDGWYCLDDSRSLVMDGDPPWPRPRDNAGATDWYFMAYQHDYKRALSEYTKIAGRIPLPPRFVFGAWWSRYWAYSDAELRQLVKEFHENDVPLDVLVIDMDWHLDGWTGYTWNPTYFPDPDGFLTWVHEQGLKATLNLHPAEGVGKQEKQFAEFSKRMGLDPSKSDRVPFDCTDPKFVKAYFELLHHPLENQGIDFWWLDWQQGTETKIPGLDPLWWLNYLHWHDMQDRAEQTERRPLIFSRWGGLGNHRYQIGFSGDTYCNWPSLAFQPEFTATAGNVGYAYWSHDIGGHQPGKVDPELYARWIQWGIFSPILRTHTTKNPAAERRIWEFPRAVFNAARDAFQLRYALVPYIYNAARQCYDRGLPLCRPLYYEWPDLDESYERKDEYLFGDQLLVRPVVAPMDSDTQTAAVNVWLPPSLWTNWFTGATTPGNSTVNLLVPLDQIPLFVRAGSIIPMAPRAERIANQPVDPMILSVFPGQSGQTSIYEDDGRSIGYQKNERLNTPVLYRPSGAVHRVTIGSMGGQCPGKPAQRAWEIRLNNVWPGQEVTVDGQPFPLAKTLGAAGWSYDGDALAAVVRLGSRPVDKPTDVTIRTIGAPADAPLLTEGLRGQLALLEAIAARLGPEAPASVRRAVELRAQLRAGSQQSIDTARFIHDNLPTLVRDVSRATKDESARRFAVGRLLGLVRDVLVLPDPKNPSGFQVIARMQINPPYGAIDGLTAQIELDPLKEGTTAPIVSPLHALPAGTWIEATAAVDMGRTLSTLAIRGRVNISLGDVTCNFPIERSLLPSINAWWVVGPFDAPFVRGLKTVFPPEQTADPSAQYTGKDGKAIRWHRVERTLAAGDDLSNEFHVMFSKVLGERHYEAVGYALTYLHAPRNMKASLAIGSDDGVAVWLNGKEVFRNDVGRAYAPKADRVPIELKKGSNSLLLKISQGGGDWSFGAHVETPDGQPLPEVEVRLEP